MSRSRKKRVVLFQEHSEKDDKKRFHRKFRRAERDTIKAAHNDIGALEDAVFPVEEEVSDVWSWRKDGKMSLRLNWNAATDWAKQLFRK